ncbi:sensor domain-containing diguanylate cyclase [Rhodoplanes azumiensis]|uniref:diguanylate cyclase n=1 Tax=Rhodoplanes azumiensis TaxID=1897628 RepID=A0ABW5AF46_9BRAD
MRFDLPTLYIVAILATAASGAMLLVAWLQNRKAATLAWWGGATLLLAVAAVVVVGRGVLPDTVSIVVGGSLWLAAYGGMWCAAHVFAGARPRPAVAAFGAVVWVMLWQLPAFRDSQETRLQAFSVLAVVILALTARAYARMPELRPVSRGLAVGLLSIQAALYAVRIPFAGHFVFPVPADQVGIVVPLWIIALFLAADSMPFLVLAMAKDRVETELRRDALRDPLTGVANRRAFFDRGERTLARTLADGRPAALLMIDLDLFKRINDRLGHAAGDAALRLFCDGTAALLRPTDLLARTGGEEFACLLPGAGVTDAMQIAERIRDWFAGQGPTIGTTDPVSVSIGVAATSALDHDLAGLMDRADRALYAAKANGRNRVEWSAPAPAAARDDRASAAFTTA